MADLAIRSVGDIVERVMIVGDLGKLTPEERVAYYKNTCEALGLNPLTRPFEYILMKGGKLTLYARKDCTDQLRKAYGISIRITARERIEDVYIVTASATTKDERCDESTGAVSIGGLKGEDMSNAFMRAETKAKRRVTLSICGLGFSDETEVESIPGARSVQVDDTGSIAGQVALMTEEELLQVSAGIASSRSEEELTGWANIVAKAYSEGRISKPQREAAAKLGKSKRASF